MLAVMYPAVLSASANVISASGSSCRNSGVSNFAVGHCFRPGDPVGEMQPRRILLVRMLARVGEQTGHAA